jgi:hypothetical protein
MFNLDYLDIFTELLRKAMRDQFQENFVRYLMSGFHLVLWNVYLLTYYLFTI